MLLKVLLFIQLLHVVNQVHFPWETGLPGVAPTNLIFLLVLLAMRGKEETVTAKPILQNALLYFFGALTFFIALIPAVGATSVCLASASSACCAISFS